MFSYHTIEEIIEDFRIGKPVILLDNEDRENEGDIMVPGEKITPEIINFMINEARGLLCLTMTNHRCEYLKLPYMVENNCCQYQTPFTVSIEAATGVTTGVSVIDRARTIKVATSRNAEPKDLVRPGHIFPLRAHSRGLFSRAGHTESGCELARLAGFNESSAIMEVMNDDGSMARRDDLEKFAKKHHLKLGLVSDLISYRIKHETSYELIAANYLKTEQDTFDLILIEDSINDTKHFGLLKGNIQDVYPVLIEIEDDNILNKIKLSKSLSPHINASMLEGSISQNKNRENLIILLTNVHL